MSTPTTALKSPASDLFLIKMEHKIDSKYVLLKSDKLNKLTNSRAVKAKSFF